MNFIYPGSFNPFHEGHLAIVKYVCENYNVDELRLEISVNNVDKERVSLEELNRRHSQIRQHTDVPILFTNYSTFHEKCKAWPETAFVVGSDTYNRILDPRYNGGNVGFLDFVGDFLKSRCHFLVFQRPGCSIEFCKFFEDFTEVSDFVPPDISSTSLRRSHEIV